MEIKFLNDDGVRTLCELIQNSLDKKANISNSIAGYGIKDAYTKTEIDEIIARLQESEEGHFFKAEENEF